MSKRRHLLATAVSGARAAAFALPAAAQMELKLGHVGGPGSLFELSANELARRANDKLAGKAKVVGQHTREVLQQCGYADSQITELAAAGAVHLGR